MDPDANLKEQLELANQIVNFDTGATDHSDGMQAHLDKAERLAELVLALNEWIANGSFLPLNWDW